MTRWLPAENGFMGMGIGAAMTGLRPIIEGMNMGFLLLAYNQISNNAGMLHYTSGGQFKVNDGNHKGRQTAQQLPFVTGGQPHMWSSQAVMLCCRAGPVLHEGQLCTPVHVTRSTAACLPAAAVGPFSTAIWLCSA